MAYVRRIPKDESKKATGWEAHVTLGRTPEGKKIRRSKTFRRKAEAEDWAREQEALPLPENPEAGQDTLAAYLQSWLDKLDAVKELRTRTRHDYRSVLRRYILEPPKGAPAVGLVRLQDVRAGQVERLYVWLRNQHGLSPRSIQGLHAVLRKALNDAVKRKILAVSPLHGVSVPRGQDESDDGRQVRSMTKEEAAAFLRAAREDRYHAVWAVLLATGLRPSEAYALRWKDMEGEVIQVRGSLSRRGVEGWILTKPKTKKSRRSVPLPGWAVEAVKAWRKVQAADRLQIGEKWEDHDFIFTTNTGAPLDDSNLRRRHFNPVLRRAGLGRRASDRKNARFIPGFTMYDLRHTCASLLLQGGVPAKVVQERLGHSTIMLTLDTYSHVLPGMQEAATSHLDSLLGEGTDG